jgi:hypothetical protein
MFPITLVGRLGGWRAMRGFLRPWIGAVGTGAAGRVFRPALTLLGRWCAICPRNPN